MNDEWHPHAVVGLLAGATARSNPGKSSQWQRLDNNNSSGRNCWRAELCFSRDVCTLATAVAAAAHANGDRDMRFRRGLMGPGKLEPLSRLMVIWRAPIVLPV